MSSTPKKFGMAMCVPVPGVKPFYPAEGKHALIDVSIAETIRMLNAMGFETYVSCSGLPEDHPGSEECECVYRAYIGFKSMTFELAVALESFGAFTVWTVKEQGDVFFHNGKSYVAYMFDDRAHERRDFYGREPSADVCRYNWNQLNALLRRMSLAPAKTTSRQKRSPGCVPSPATA